MQKYNPNRKELPMRRHLRSVSLTSLSMLAVLSTTSAHAEDIWGNNQTQAPAQEIWARPQPQTELNADVADDGPKGPPKKEGWNFEVGAGAVYSTAYEGSDKYQAMPFPNISVDYEDGLFFASPFGGIGSYPIQGENYKVGAAIGFGGGRNEDDDKKNLRGMGDIDSSITADLMGEYSFGPVQISGKITKGNEDYGMTAEADIGTMLPVTDDVMVMAKVGTKWADENSMTTYFGVSPTQSARSGYARYTPEAGFKSVGISVGAFYNISENWDAMLMISGDQLIGDAADSPIVKQTFQPTTMLGVSYKF
jgi:MipA family protein